MATSDERPAPPTRTNALPHLPALDGLRGLAVIGVLLFHGGFTWARGGFLGVSTFFTLSGFLITNLLVREFDRSGRIDLVRFWARRFRRLLPAALLAIALVGIVWWIIGSSAQVTALRGDMWSAIAYVANWRFLFSGTSYASLFSDPSPLQHFWSLAIEEQFYLVFPPVVLFVMAVGGRRLLAVLTTIATLGSVGLLIVARDDFDRIYYGTDTRAAELLLGVLLAIWWSGRQRAHDMTTGRRGRAADIAGLIALAGVLVSWSRVPETWDWLGRGGLPIYAIATSLIIYIATRPGWTTAVLSMTTTPTSNGCSLRSIPAPRLRQPSTSWAIRLRWTPSPHSVRHSSRRAPPR